MKNTLRNTFIAAITITMAAIWLDATARPITREQAHQTARQFMQQRGDTRQLKIAVSAYPKTTCLTGAGKYGSPVNDMKPYYVFDRGNQEGFVIVAADDRMKPILAYSTESGFNSKMMDLEISAEFTSKYGFSVVAPMRITVPSSTKGSR